MKKLILAMLMVVSSFVYAVEAPPGFSSLTTAQKAEFALQIAKQAEDTKSSVAEVPNVDVVSKWASVGTELGKALAGTARELGVVANDFIKTPVGQITIGLIVWKFMGTQILHVGGAILMLLIMLPTWFWLFRRMTLSKIVTQTPTQIEGKVKIVTEHSIIKQNEDCIIPMILFLVVIIVAAIILGLTG